MKKYLSAIFSLVGIGVFLSCRNKPVLSTAANRKSLLWEITGKDLRKPSYFFGTIHLMCAEDAVLTEIVKSLIKNTDQVYLEVDLDNPSELLNGILELRSKNGESLQRALKPEEYARVKNFFEKYQPGVPFSVLELQPPLMISSSLFELLLPCEKKNGVEIKIIDEAYKEKKETKGLETVAFQASIFDSIPYADQAKDLVKSIDSLEKNRKAINEMIQVYKDQDIEKLYHLSTSEESSTSNYMDLLLFNRNRNWVDRFSAIATNSSTLFAVGAGHLGGEKGVLQLLRNEGYTVRPIKN
ncbi:MAG: TraB/GumN family protein [Bacteroidota bacterium]|nr:TraB/GumN family protein [Bacteroidota bacterium]